MQLRICKWACGHPFFSRFCSYEVISYLVCGVLTTVVSYVSYFAARAFLDSVVISQCISWILAVLFAYWSNKLFVFLSEDWSRETLCKELPSFLSCRIFSFLVETVFLVLTVNLFCWNEPLMKILSNVFVLIINYIGSKLFVFR